MKASQFFNIHFITPFIIFSPEDEEQVISFSFPLTIIVGANGCGKTTIIEALKLDFVQAEEEGALPTLGQLSEIAFF